MEDVQGFLRALDSALGDQRRRLASEAIRRVLARSQESAVARRENADNKAARLTIR